jgi:hypothetical protein
MRNDGTMGKRAYSQPRLSTLGSIAEVTLKTPARGAIKGGGVIWHYDKFNEESGIETTGS